MTPTLSPIELAAINEALAESRPLHWELESNPYGGAYWVAYAGKKKLFSSGMVKTFRALYDQARTLWMKRSKK